MKHLLLLSLTAIFVSTAALADPGDTTVVQTFTFEEQNDPDAAYDSPGRRWFEFPDDETSYQKILMYYTLKCFEDGTAGGLGFPCGEWDYLTYNYLFDHTGELDSNLLAHPFYLLNNADFEEVDLVSEPQFNTIQYETIETNVISEEDMTLAALTGDGSLSAMPLLTENTASRFQFIYTAEELLAAGLTAGDISRLTMNLNFQFDSADLLRIKVGQTTETELTSLFDGFMQEVYASDFTPTEMGGYDFTFSENVSWDGTTSLVVELAITNEDFGFPTDVQGETISNKAVAVLGQNRFMKFDNVDEVVVPGEVFDTIDEQVTVAFWVFGDPDAQPLNSTVFEGVNASNARVLNSHLPWGNGRVYWDAGQDGGYDRIDKLAATTDYEGQWNHWAFTKNNATETMNIYLNGELWHTGEDKDNSMAGIVEFSIGSATGWSNFYRGNVDEFQVWDVELDEATIAEWMTQRINNMHPNWDNLRVYYNFDEENQSYVLDQSPNGFDAYPQGAPDRLLYESDELFIGETAVDFRPEITLHQGDVVVDNTVVPYEVQVQIAPVVLTTWEVAGNDVEMVNLEFYWEEGSTYVYDEEGNEISSTPIDAPLTNFVNSELSYYSEAFEVVDRYEIGRYITPYGINLDLEEGWTWVFDVSDYEPLLHGMVELEAGNWQELLDMKFLFIEGTPPRDVKRVDAFWKGQYNLSTFDENVVAHEFEVQDGEEMFRLKTRASGHGFGTGNNCGEFCFNTHSVLVNNETQWSWEIMQECADNALYPQGGTWIYDRAGWCPGAKVATQNFELTPLVDGQESFTVDYDINYDPDGNYRFEGQIIAYGEANFANDVEINDVIAPSNWRIKSRINPICDNPIIQIRNNGSTPLTSCEITYGIGTDLQTITWTGNLGFLETEDVVLTYDSPLLWDGDDEQTLQFLASVGNPNGVTDENEFNNDASSSFVRPPTYTYGTGEDDDNRLIIWIQTNGAPWETSASIEAADGTVVWSRDDYNDASTNYRDTIQLNAGCYTFNVLDSDDDGLSFFANNDGNGQVRLKKVAGGSFIQFENDFGKSISHNFSWETDLVSVEEQLVEEVQLTVYPNPADHELFVKAANFGNELTYTIIDLHGKILATRQMQQSPGDVIRIDTHDLASGMYTVIIDDGVSRAAKRWVKE
ncbi:MAG: peptide-N-glycosidase F-related protein [Flavobacteriales bacterium]|nr:peptide-N-glycosidase F-related protein [Flavobacteriales bacterium]